MSELVKITQIKPNDWNPNQMTDEEFAELVAEVRHLGKVPKPIVLRKNGKGYEIVDGEHTYRALVEVGRDDLEPGWYEIEDYDDFEAMRQTYKRNQHGHHNPVKQGLLFERMMSERGLSARALAKEVELSEGTIRNSLEYSKALQVRNDYALSELTIKQIRMFNRLPSKFAGMWHRAGCKMRDLLFDSSDTQIMQSGGVDSAFEEMKAWDEDPLEPFAKMNEAGLDEFFIQDKWAGFRSVAADLWDIYKLARRHSRGAELEQFWPYMVPYKNGKFVVRSEMLFKSALERLVYLDSEDRLRFVVTSDEFSEMVEVAQSAHELHEYLDLKRFQILPGDDYKKRWELQAQMALMRIEKLQPPEYILDAARTIFAEGGGKWKLRNLEEVARIDTDGNPQREMAKRKIAAMMLERGGQTFWKNDWELKKLVSRYAEQVERKVRQSTMTDTQLAEQIASDTGADAAILSQLSRPALEILENGVRVHLEQKAYFRHLESILGKMGKPANDKTAGDEADNEHK